MHGTYTSLIINLKYFISVIVVVLAIAGCYDKKNNHSMDGKNRVEIDQVAGDDEKVITENNKNKRTL